MARRLNKFDEYPLPDDGCASTGGNVRRRSTKAGGRGGPRCRIVSRSRTRASGPELFQNKLKKWIDRKKAFVEELSALVDEQYARSDLFLRANFTEEEFDQTMLSGVLSIAAEPRRRPQFLRKLIPLARERLDRATRDQQLARLDSSMLTPAQLEAYYNDNGLMSPKSDGTVCAYDAARQRTTIRSDRGRHACVIAHRYSDREAAGFEQYSDFLYEKIRRTEPADLFFDQQKTRLATQAATALFREMAAWTLD